MKKNFIDVVNKETMRKMVSEYSILNSLTPPENAALNVCSDQVRGKPILDLGVGGGRTVEALTSISKDYIGIDYVQEMITKCRNSYPHVNFREADARSLTNFQENYYALIVFACNGISMVDHAGRLAILKEAYRLLAPDGFFIFSTYNRKNAKYKTWFQFPEFSFTNNPIKLGVRICRFFLCTVRRMKNRFRLKGYEKQYPEYAIINDVCHDYSTMQYYLSIHEQQRQLESIGFLPNANCFDLSGHEVLNDSEDDSITYIARKPH